MSVYAEVDNDVTSAAKGDGEAFVRLVTAYANTVNSIALSIVRDVHGSQDIAQEVFLVAWRDVAKLRNTASFLPWIRQVTRNRAHEWLRTERSRVTDRDADAILARTVDPALSAPEVLEKHEQQRIVSEVIDGLPDESREVITLFYSEGRSVRQVSGLLGIREDAVKKRLSRARQRVREELLEQFGAVMKKTAPAGTIAAAVSSSLTLASPAVAATTSASASKLAGTSLLGKALAGTTGALVGAAVGSAAMMFGVRRNLAGAFDDRERSELKRFGRVGVTVILAMTLGIWLSAARRSPTLLVCVQTLVVLLFGWMYRVWLPRIMKRRLEAELARDPAAAALHRRANRISWFGLLTGVLLSTVTVIWAVVSMLR